MFAEVAEQVGIDFADLAVNVKLDTGRRLLLCVIDIWDRQKKAQRDDESYLAHDAIWHSVLPFFKESSQK